MAPRRTSKKSDKQTERSSNGKNTSIDQEAALEKLYKAACDAIHNDTHTTISAAAKAFGVDYQNLRNRYLGLHGPAQHAHEKQQLLPNPVEEVVADWSIFLSLTGHGLTRKTIGYKVQLLCQKVPNQRWVNGFLKRHPAALRFSRPAGLDPKRAQAFNRPVMRHHFDLLDNMVTQLKVKPRNMYNVDEKGLQIGGGRKNSGCKVLFSREDRARYRVRDSDLELVTIIECISADGSALKPGFIFHGKSTNFDMDWLEVDDEISVGLSPNGWTDDFLCARWFEETFIPQARARVEQPGEPIVLIYDGHGSHTSDQLLNVAFKTPDIHLFCLPPKTTHNTQPLDVGVFGPTQRAWSDRCTEVVATTGQGIPKSDIVKEYMLAREKAFTPEIILQAWRRSGIHPLNPNVFTDADFAPSLATSTAAHFPSSYPGEIILDPPIAQGEVNEVQDAIIRGWARYRDRTIEQADNHTIQGPVIIVETLTEAQKRESLEASPSADHEPSSTSSAIASHGSSLVLRSSRRSRHIVSPFTMVPSPRASANEKLKASVQQCRMLQDENARLRRELQQAQAHASLARAENETLRTRFAAQSHKKTKRTVHGKARWLTSAEGKLEFAAQEQERREKEAQEAAKAARREEKQREDEERRLQIAIAGDAHRFEGPLYKKRKTDLQDIATALGIPFDSNTKVDDLRQLISTCLINNAATLHENNRFNGLYVGALNRQAPQMPAPLFTDRDGSTPPRSHTPTSPVRSLTPSDEVPMSNSAARPFNPTQSADATRYAAHHSNLPLPPIAGPSRLAPNHLHQPHDPYNLPAVSHSYTDDAYAAYHAPFAAPSPDSADMTSERLETDKHHLPYLQY